MDENELTKIVDGIFRHQPISPIQRQCLEPFIARAIRRAYAEGMERSARAADRRAKELADSTAFSSPACVDVLHALADELLAAAKETP